jgi:hypothetical protein
MDDNSTHIMTKDATATANKNAKVFNVVDDVCGSWDGRCFENV